MKIRSAMLASAVLASMALFATPAVSAQTEPGYKTPHTSWGAPDLQGFWSNASLTGMQRPAGASGLVVSEEEPAKLAKRNIYSAVQRGGTGASKVDSTRSPGPTTMSAEPEASRPVSQTSSWGAVPVTRVQPL